MRGYLVGLPAWACLCTGASSCVRWQPLPVSDWTYLPEPGGPGNDAWRTLGADYAYLIIAVSAGAGCARGGRACGGRARVSSTCQHLLLLPQCFRPRQPRLRQRPAGCERYLFAPLPSLHLSTGSCSTLRPQTVPPTSWMFFGTQLHNTRLVGRVLFLWQVKLVAVGGHLAMSDQAIT